MCNTKQLLEKTLGVFSKCSSSISSNVVMLALAKVVGLLVVLILTTFSLTKVSISLCVINATNATNANIQLALVAQ